MLVYHQKQWEFLKKKFELDQLSHAYLFVGPKEIGKKTFAIELVKALNCLGEEKPCRNCVNCLMIDKNSFPDLMLVSSAKEIEISKIRQIQNFLGYKSYYGSFKIVVVDDAQNMNQEAQSCFLKTLEEPKGKTLIILVSSRPDMLLATILSRCQTIKFFKPKDLSENPDRQKKEKEILKNLMPVINSNLADKFKYVKSIDFEQQELGDILEVIQKYLRQQLLFEVKTKYSFEKVKKLVDLTEDINNKLLFTNANPRLALEILLMEM